MAPITDREVLTGGNAISAMVVISSALVLVALPFFMVGGLAVQIKAELELSEASLGAAVTIGFLSGAFTAPFGGRIADRVGPRRAVYIGCSIATTALLSLGLFTTGWSTLVGFLCLGGIGVALTDPGLAILVGVTVPGQRQGLAFGVKEASIPAATLVAGLAVPTIALTVGWRWAFLIAVLPLALVLVLLPRLQTQMQSQETIETELHEPATPPPKRRALLLAATAAALGTTAASGVGIFLTDSAVAMGMTPGNAGLLLATGSLAGIVTRVATGALADRTGGPQFGLIASMLAVGAVTMSLGGTGNTLLLILGTIGAFTGGWAWTGIYFLSLVKTFPDRPGTVAGIGTAGLGVGNAAGPVLFGLAAGAWSFGAAWVGAGVIAALAALLMVNARRRF
ncbi:MAG TPA: MFS transporter [Acidimicrobiia bacterium]|nr:MFS transporter [Acidimicrobiia bacterium]